MLMNQLLSTRSNKGVIDHNHRWQQRYKSILVAGSMSLAGLMIGCQSTATTQLTAPPSLPKNAVLINKATNLYQVDKLLFRSEQLRAADIPLLKANRIDAILNLRFFDRNDDEKLLADIVSETSLDLYNQPLKSWYVTPKEIAKALNTIKDLQAQNKSVLVHCYHGADRTGLIIAMYRIIEQEWSIEHAKQEMVAGGFGYHAVWVNLENMLNPKTVAAVRIEM